MHEIDVIYRDAAQYTACSGEVTSNSDYLRQESRVVPYSNKDAGPASVPFPLVEAGTSVAGLDNSPALLQFAAGKNDDVKWIEGDMRTFDLNESSL